MGKRSSFERNPRDFYPTPREAVVPLVDHLEGMSYVEPCVGAGDLLVHLDNLAAMSCYWCGDINPASDNRRWHKKDALDLTLSDISDADYIITNPPWGRKVLHPMIEHFSAMRPTWLLFDADWVHTRQSAPYMPWLRKIVSVGRVKWIPDSKMTGKDNCAWHLFDQNASGPTVFIGRNK